MRQPRSVTAEYLRYSLAGQSDALASELGHTTAGRTAKTLAKSDNLRVTLVRMSRGSAVHPAATAGAATVQVLSGRLSVEMDGTREQAGPGELLIFSQNLRQPLEALADSTFLVTVAWEEGAGAWEQEEREGRH